jgi:cytochrome bd ubiquinol oxidase subunit I
VVGAGGAWHLLRGRDNAAVRKMFSMAMWMVLFTAPIQAVIGDFHGLNTLKHQPAKLAAIEGHWESRPGAGVPLILFGVPDMEREETRYALAIPNLGSVILTHSWDGQIPGLKEFAREDRPNSTIVFWTFRIMVGLGVLMILLSVWSALLRARGKLYQSRTFLRGALLMGPAGIIAILAGWYTTEIGRQPWVIYGLMRTADAASAHSAGQVGLTLAIFVIVYLIVFGAGTVYALRLIAQGPKIDEGAAPTPGGPGEPRQPMRPLSGAKDDRSTPSTAFN